MAASGEEIRGSGGSKEEQVEVARGTFPSVVASDTGAGTVSQRSGETCASTHASTAQEIIDALKKSQEEIPYMGKEKVLALEERLRALRPLVLQRIKVEEEKAAAAEQATAPEPRRAG